MAKRRKSPAGFPSRETVLEYLDTHPGRVSRRELARVFGVGADRRAELRDMLRDLESEGLIGKGRGRAVRSHATLPAVCVLEIVGPDEDGDLIARPLASRDDPDPPTVYMKPEGRGRSALGRGDRVLARVQHRGGNHYEGQTMRRVGSAPRTVLGIFDMINGQARVRPTDKRARHDLIVATGETAGARPGDLVRAKTMPGRKLGLTKAKILERLETDTKSLSLIALHEHEIPIDFSAEAITQAESAAAAPLDEREDLRAVPLVTIDGADARDFDDAVFAEPDDDPENPGGWHAIVAIADVSWYVRPGDALDKDAYTRGNSVYLPDRAVPMLPEALSNGWCSLKPDEDRPCLAVHLWIDTHGKALRHKFVRGLMRSAARLTYEQVQAAHEGVTDDRTAPLLKSAIKPLYGAFRSLMLARTARGTLDLDLPERRVELDQDGRVVTIAAAPRYDSHRLIEEFMITANVAAAETLTRKKAPCLYRVHDAPDTEKLESLREVLDGLGFNLARGQVIKPAHFNRLLARVAGLPEAQLVNDLILRSQAQAEYAPSNIGHFGLALRKYCHFTSPIRRYADLLVHRSLIARLGLGEGGLPGETDDLGLVGEHVSMTERRAAMAERDAIDRYTADWLSDQEGAVFPARIAGVIRGGLFVRLEESSADGLIPKRFLPRDTYIYDEKRHVLRGRSSKREFRLGDSVEVMLAEATPETGGLVFHLLDAGSEKPWKGRKKRRR
ncbi:MAG: ribonuclease R [Rhodospirillales bacterium]|nr:ribonuclease R [Rhodospirillales bacterium]